MVKRFFMKFYLVLIIAFLYIPIAVLVVLSFNASRSRVVWGGFTLKWYQILLHNSDVVAALQNTLTIGFASAAIATGIGLLAAIVIDAMKKRSYSLTLGIGNIPMLNADIVTLFAPRSRAASYTLISICWSFGRMLRITYGILNVTCASRMLT